MATKRAAEGNLGVGYQGQSINLNTQQPRPIKIISLGYTETLIA